MSEDIDERLRRALAADPSRPGADVRVNILTHARRLADARRAAPAKPPALPAAKRRQWRGAAFGTAAAAAWAGLLLAPHFREAGAPAPVPTTAPAPPPVAAAAPTPAPAPTAEQRIRGLRNLQAQASSQDQSLKPRAASFDAGARLREAARDGDMDRLSPLLSSADIDARDARGRTALMLAASRGRTAAVEALLAHGADPNAVDATGSTALELARAAGRDGIAAILQRSGAH